MFQFVTSVQDASEKNGYLVPSNDVIVVSKT